MPTKKFLPILLFAAAIAQAQSVLPVSYQPITPEQRLAWFTKRTVGPASLATSFVGAGIDTWRDTPREYGPHWGGFGQRIGIRVTNKAISNGIEAGAGSLWGEDPRYFRVPEKRLSARLGNVVKMTVISHNREGHEMPAYARFIAVPSTEFLSNTWRPVSQDDGHDAVNRIAIGFATRIAGNAFSEFWPDLSRKFIHRRAKNTTPDFVDQFAAESGK